MSQRGLGGGLGRRRPAGCDRAAAACFDGLGLGLERLAELLSALLAGGDHALDLGLGGLAGGAFAKDAAGIDDDDDGGRARAAPSAAPGTASESAARAAPKANLFIRMRFLR